MKEYGVSFKQYSDLSEDPSSTIQFEFNTVTEAQETFHSMWKQHRNTKHRIEVSLEQRVEQEEYETIVSRYSTFYVNPNMRTLHTTTMW